MRSALTAVDTAQPRPVGIEPVSGGEILDRTSTGGELVQWLDYAGGVWTAQVSPALLGEDLADTSPIRTGAQYPNRRNRHGWYAWTGWSRHIWFESALEMETLVDLDQRGAVVAIAAQPMRVLFGDASPCVSHVPDYFAVRSDGGRVLIDVKPRSRMTAKVAQQFAETARVCALVGWAHEVIHEASDERRRNLAWLREFRHTRCHPSPEQFERVLEVFRSGRSIGEGRTMVDLRYPMNAMPTIGHLLWHRHLAADWERPFGRDTVLNSTSRGTTCCRPA